MVELVQRLVWAALLFGTVYSEVLNSFIKHYEPLHYDSESLMWNHHRVRRSMVGEKEVELKFSAFGRDFDLVLKPETSFFHKNFTLIIGGKKASSHLAKYHVYSGTDRNDPSVRVHGNLGHEVFDGAVITDDEMYHIEPSRRYLRDADHHSVIYRRSDLDLSALRGASCGSADEEIHKQMLNVQESMIHDAESARLRRQGGSVDSNRVRCWLRTLADRKFVEALEAMNDNPMLTMINVILMGSTIFQGTDFNDDGTEDGIVFGIQTLMVEEAGVPSTDPFFDQAFIGVQAFLTQHSTADYSDYCLSYRFTSRDFNDGVVGLAYIAAQPGTNAAGGICENQQTFSGGVMRTLNTGIVTVLNYGRRVPVSASVLTFAHEAGHNFGSNHDPRPDTPDPGGVYIMDAFSSDGSQPNNDMFSLRSRAEMLGPIQTRGQNSVSGCFEFNDGLCGNNLLDEGEQCDCGPAVDDNGLCRDDPCCNGTSCTLPSNIVCSPEQGPCCNASCMFWEEEDNITCSTQTDCAMPQICNGTVATCPDPEPLPNDPGLSYRLCGEDGDAICAANARCEGTFCLALDLDDCECSSAEQACHVCCRVGPGNGSCTSTLDIAAQNISGLAARLPGGMGATKQVGFPCINFTGYCDFFDNCMIVNQDGALAQLANLIFNSAEFQLVIRWISTMWWVVVIVLIVLMVLLFIFVLVIHLCLPRPEKVRRKRLEKRRQRREKERLQMENIQGGKY